MRRFLPIAALAVYCLLSLAACLRGPQPVSGLLRGDVAWRGTVIVRGDLILASGSRLVIAPGTTVLFAPPGPGDDLWTEHPHFPGSELIVRGTLVAEGTAAAPISFRHLDPAAPAASWGGINLQQSPSAIFRYCLFTQADSALHSQESTVRVEQSRFEGNGVGIRFHTSEILIKDNLLRDNGTAIRFHYGSPTIVGNEIRENDKGLFITAHPRDFRIVGNHLLANREFNVVLGEEVPEDVAMPGNWWGSADQETLQGTFFDAGRDPHLGWVQVEPVASAPVAGVGASWPR